MSSLRNWREPNIELDESAERVTLRLAALSSPSLDSGDNSANSGDGELSPLNLNIDIVDSDSADIEEIIDRIDSTMNVNVGADEQPQGAAALPQPSQDNLVIKNRMSTLENVMQSFQQQQQAVLSEVQKFSAGTDRLAQFLHAQSEQREATEAGINAQLHGLHEQHAQRYEQIMATLQDHMNQMHLEHQRNLRDMEARYAEQVHHVQDREVQLVNAHAQQVNAVQDAIQRQEQRNPPPVNPQQQPPPVVPQPGGGGQPNGNPVGGNGNNPNHQNHAAAGGFGGGGGGDPNGGPPRQPPGPPHGGGGGGGGGFPPRQPPGPPHGGGGAGGGGFPG